LSYFILLEDHSNIYICPLEFIAKKIETAKPSQDDQEESSDNENITDNYN
jgi:hypothetical protein